MRSLIPALFTFAFTVGAVWGDELLVVAPREFTSALEEYVAHKRITLPTALVTLEDALAGVQGTDDAEKLKRFLFERWKRGGLKYALLVGDADVLPVRYMVLDRVTPAAFDYSFYPSDLYYADLAKTDGSFDDWNAQRDGFHAQYFGEVRGEKNKTDPINFDRVDYLPDIAVGRWPVSTLEQVRAVATKTVRAGLQRRERTRTKSTTVDASAAGGRPRLGIIGTTGWVNTRRHFNAIEALFQDGWEIERRLYTGEVKNAANAADLTELWNRGQDLILHAGHGQPGEWEQCFTRTTLPALAKAPRLPVVFSAGCSTAYFAALAPYDGYVDVEGAVHRGTDRKQVFTGPPPPPANYQKGKYNKTGLGEELVRMPEGGAAAYIGCNTGSQPCGLTLQRGFVLAAAKSGTRLGDAWNAAICYYHREERLADLKPNDSWYPPSIFFQAMKFMVFGDPTLEL